MKFKPFFLDAFDATRMVEHCLKFDDRWNYLNCIGTIDGKHIILQSPINNGSEYINYKGTFSLVYSFSGR